MPSPVSSQLPAPPVVATSVPNGSQHGALTPIEAGGPVINAPIDSGILPDERTPDPIGEGKQKAKAVLAAAGVTLPAPSANQSSTPTSLSTSTSTSTSTAPSQTSSARERPTPAPRPTKQALLLDQYTSRDHLNAAALHAQNLSNIDAIHAKRIEVDLYKGPVKRERQQNPGAIFGHGYAGFGNGHTDGKTRVIYPFQRRRPGGRRTRELRIPRKDMATQADQIEELIPVRLDVDWDKIKLRDTFTWNLHDRVISPELFAEQLVEDFKLPPETADPLVRFVAQTLAEQIQDFYPQVFIEEDPLDPHLPYHAYKNDEMRVLIKLNITIGQHTLVDQFEWELNNPLNSPEDFAKQMTRELSLSGEFTTAIAHCIREQCQLFTKSLYITGHPFDGRPIDDADLKDAFLPSPLLSVFRAAQHAKEFAPGLWELSEIELDRAENSLSREQRRQKRTMNRRGGPALPDLKDRQRTVRTLVVSSVLPGAAESVDESRLFKRVEISTGRSGRRAAAGQKAGVDDSDLSESEESGPESPATSTMLMTGTSRTRGIRGAASAAQAAMRANVGRSTTPEPAALHHHETRTSARRLGTHEDSVGEGNSLIVKFKISREKFRQFERDRKARARAESTQQGSLAPGGRPSSQGSTPQGGTPAHGSMGPPPSTPGLGSASLPATASNGVAGTPQPPGAVDADHPPQPGQPGPPPPPWLLSSLATLRQTYPLDSFDGFMRYAAVDADTGVPIPTAVLQQHQQRQAAAAVAAAISSSSPNPGAASSPSRSSSAAATASSPTTAAPLPRIKHLYLPRIRCNDCPGKLYTPGPETTVGNFEVHLKNRSHRSAVEKRLVAASRVGKEKEREKPGEAEDGESIVAGDAGDAGAS